MQYQGKVEHVFARKHCFLETVNRGWDRQEFVKRHFHGKEILFSQPCFQW
jgi:hypothetical protein